MAFFVPPGLAIEDGNHTSRPVGHPLITDLEVGPAIPGTDELHKVRSGHAGYLAPAVELVTTI